MLRKLLLIISVYSIHSGFAQYCTSGGPSQTIDSNVESVVLAGSSGTINYTGCPGVVGVEEVLAQSATLNANSSYTAVIQFGTCGGNYSGAGEAWIDYNLNGVFEASESIGTWQGTPPTSVSNFNFTVPGGATNGTTRMRVMQHEAGALPLDPCASYAWGSVVDFTIIIQGGTGTGGGSTYCSGGPTSTADSNVESVVLNGNSTSINYTGCPGVTGIEQSTQSADLGIGMNYVMDVQFGTCGGNYAGVGEAWIDFNQNQIFEASESVGTWQGTPPTALSQFNFTVPAGATLGTTKMRVIQREAGTLPIDPCASYTWGSAVDFTIEIVEGIDCSGYSGDTQDDAINVGTLPYTDNSSNTICYTNQHPVYPSSDVYYLYEPAAGVEGITASLCGSAFDTYLTVTDKYGNILNSNDDYASCGSNSQLTVSVMGIDSVFIIVEGWGTLSGDYTLNIYEEDLSLVEENLMTVKIFPNPAEDKFNLYCDHELTELQLKEINGKVIKIFDPSQKEFNVSDIPSGVYFLTLSTNENTLTKKLIRK